jgi:adenosine deaminase
MHLTSPIGELAALIRRMPKTETHLHIEGALPLQLLREVAPERFADGPPQWWLPDFRYDTFEQFERILIDNAVLWFTSPERYHEAARLIFAGLLAQNVRYVETSFHIGVLEMLSLDGPAVVDAILSAAPRGMTVRVFMGMLRRNYTSTGAPIIDRMHTWENLSGCDLHGIEVQELEPWTAAVWERMRAHGKVTKAHAGEFGGAKAVREAIERLGVRRIQHGVQSVEDAGVVRLLLDTDATCDITPISNVKLRVVSSLREHPIRRFVDAGVRCTVSTDDPFSFGNRLEDEYLALATEAGFSRNELIDLARNGFAVALLPENEKRRWMGELDALKLQS